MRDGYYLSTYLNPVGLYRAAHVTFRHDHNVSLWHLRGTRVELLGHWEIERISGQKQHRTPVYSAAGMIELIDSLLKPFCISHRNLQAHFGSPGLDFLGDYVALSNSSNLAQHSISHLYSSIYTSDAVFRGDTIVGFAVDRGPDRLLDAGFRENWFVGSVTSPRGTELFPIESPGPLYGAAKDRFGLREGSLMALASASHAHAQIDEAAILSNYRFTSMESVKDAADAVDMIFESASESVTDDHRFSKEDNLLSAVMKAVQSISEAMMDRNVALVTARFDLDLSKCHLALSGGFALNCPANSHLMKKYKFMSLIAPPFVSDGGQSIGIALELFHHKLDDSMQFEFQGPYLGNGGGDLYAALEDSIDSIKSIRPFSAEDVVRDVTKNPIVWFQGRSESGPRALGNRSILADPRTMKSKEALNRIKQREWWRPVAPIVLENASGEWFEDSRNSPYMLETFQVRPEKINGVPAVVHLDGSARIQTLSHTDNAALHEIVSKFAEITGVPMICNTSLNDNGEPIIDTYEQALHFCKEKQIDVCYLDDRRIEWKQAKPTRVSGPLPRGTKAFVLPPKQQLEQDLARMNPYGLTEEALYIYLLDGSPACNYDLTSPEGVEAAKQFVAEHLQTTPNGLTKAREGIKRAKIRFLTS